MTSPGESSRMASPVSSSVSRSERTPPETVAVIPLLLQRHRAALTRQLVTPWISRVLCVGIVVIVLVSRPSAIAALFILPIAIIVVVWTYDSRITEREIMRTEEALSDYTGVSARDMYIRSGVPSLHFLNRIARIEPLIWLMVATVAFLYKTFLSPL
jgi:hypothetical protein